ncbi:acyl-CoA thioesterase/BAAT N-terminal domain-containing protein [endosymbiont 'TC1' of Trimyema compressum]|uniref:acyl-CoA thioesterase/BAAT N-terminal domain-containing protein n=1 Tax=endosymbiont 'TC1' of Trimyema compressum TaxID=243899 RepID=UPI001FDF1DC0|nr:acyl-CoA thioesterase/BAAT N-terminal domain-containing protein [endosymbiont 'TC1' of Trimyema compressum]
MKKIDDTTLIDSNCIIKIMPNKSFINEDVDITISGLKCNQKVIVRAESKDYYCINCGMLEQGKNSLWESYGVFISDDNGNIFLKSAMPIDGTYKDCNSMGLFYSMKIKNA